MEARYRTVTVTYRRQVSDGSYGTESSECHLEWFVEDDNNSEVDIEFANEMLSNARDVVLNTLRGSLSQHVRHAVTRTIAPPKTAATVPDDVEELPF